MKAFTLIEVLLSIVIIGILSSVILSMGSGIFSQNKFEASKAKFINDVLNTRYQAYLNDTIETLIIDSTGEKYIKYNSFEVKFPDGIKVVPGGFNIRFDNLGGCPHSYTFKLWSNSGEETNFKINTLGYMEWD